MREMNQWTGTILPTAGAYPNIFTLCRVQHNTKVVDEFVKCKDFGINQLKSSPPQPLGV